MKNTILLLTTCLVVMGALAGCQQTDNQSSTPIPLAQEITYYDWPDDLPQSVIDRFTQEFGVKVNYVTYGSREEAVQKLEEGLAADVVNMGPCRFHTCASVTCWQRWTTPSCPISNMCQKTSGI